MNSHLSKFLLCLMIVYCSEAIAQNQKRSDADLAPTKILLSQYSRNYFSPVTNLPYSRKVGAQGASVLETPDEIKAGRVHGKELAWGYGSGMADVGYHAGILLFALCDAYDTIQDPEFAVLAQRVHQGLMLMSTISPVPGFVPRGPHPDDLKAYYRNSSVDQHTLYICGLWRFYKSPLSTSEQRLAIAQVIASIAQRIEGHGWVIRDEAGIVDAHAGGSLLKMQSSSISALLMILAITADVTGEGHWHELYLHFSNESNEVRWNTLATEKLWQSYPRYNTYHNQDIFRMETLRRIESDPRRKVILRTFIRRRAMDMIEGPYLKMFRGEGKLENEQLLLSNIELLASYGIAIHPQATLGDVVNLFDLRKLTPEQISKSGALQSLCLTNPAAAWHIALLGRDPGQLHVVSPMIQDAMERLDIPRVRSVWSINYLAVASLLNIAATPEP